MPRNTRPDRVLDALLELFGGEIETAFYEAILDITSNVHLTSLIDHIENENIEAAFQVLGIDSRSLRPVSNATESAFFRAGHATGNTFPRWLDVPTGRIVFRFDERNLRSERFLRQKSSEFVTRITNEQRSIVRETLEAGLRRGENPRRTALDLAGRINRITGRREGGIVGLAENQLQWLRNVNDDLDNLNKRYFTRRLRDRRFDSVVRRAIETNTPLTVEQKARIAGRFKDRALRFRAENIGRTEAIEALNRADYEATQQLIDLGAIENEHITRIWDSSGDDGITRASHLSMEGQERGLNEPFETPSGELLLFPGDKSQGATPRETNNCRCRVRTKIDFLARAT